MAETKKAAAAPKKATAEQSETPAKVLYVHLLPIACEEMSD